MATRKQRATPATAAPKPSPDREPVQDPTNTDGPEIDEEIVIGGTPGGAGAAPVEGRPVRVAGMATREYAAGSALQWYVNIPKALPWQIDDVSTDFGSDVYDRMLNDPQCRSTVNVLKSSILEEGAQFRPAVDDKDKDGFKQATDLVDRVERMVDELDTSLDDTLWDMLDAHAVGHRMAEQVYTLDSTYTGKTEYVLETLAVKPRESVAFVVDVYMNVLAIIARVPGQPFAVQQGMLLTDIEHTGNVLPRSKFAILSHRPKNNDPRGTSILRAAFSPWNQKTQLAREFLKYLTQFAVPSLIGYTPPEARPYQVQNADGTPKLDASGIPVVQTPEEAMLQALEQFANGTATAFPHGALVVPIEMKGEGKAFLEANAFLDRQITKAVLQQTLATEEGEHQTRASTSTHKDILDTVVRQMKRPVERMIRRDILRTWLRLNGLEDLIDLLPLVTLGTSETEDYPRLWTAMAGLWGANYLHQSQLPVLDQMLGLPERTPADATTMPEKETVLISEDGGAVDPETGKPVQQPQPAQPEDGQDNSKQDTASDGAGPKESGDGQKAD